MNTECVLIIIPKGQIKPKADLCVVYSPKKQTNERIWVFSAVKSKEATKTNLFVCFLGESAAR